MRAAAGGAVNLLKGRVVDIRSYTLPYYQEGKIMRSKGISLVEILVVIAIILLILGLLLPVIITTRKRAHESVCINNLHQLGVSINLYLTDYHELAPRLHRYFAYSKSKDIFVCPRDMWASSSKGGGNRHETAMAGFSISYMYILHPVCYPRQPLYRQCVVFRRLLEERDPNHGVAYCLLHGNTLGNFNQTYDAETWYDGGPILRLRKDGTVQRVAHGVPLTNCGARGYRSYWRYVTDAPCPEQLGFLYCGCGKFRDE
jgi:type II secretory pathway pseudopilin PulG